jgi:hypothetical protein
MSEQKRGAAGVNYVLQVVLGLVISLALALLALIVAMLKVQVVTAMWVAFFIATWIGCFVAMRRRYNGIVVGLLIGCACLYVATKLLFTL